MECSLTYLQQKPLPGNSANGIMGLLRDQIEADVDLLADGVQFKGQGHFDPAYFFIF